MVRSASILSCPTKRQLRISVVVAEPLACHAIGNLSPPLPRCPVPRTAHLPLNASSPRAFRRLPCLWRAMSSEGVQGLRKLENQSPVSLRKCHAPPPHLDPSLSMGPVPGDETPADLPVPCQGRRWTPSRPVSSFPAATAGTRSATRHAGVVRALDASYRPQSWPHEADWSKMFHPCASKGTRKKRWLSLR